MNVIIRSITHKILGQGNHICPKSCLHYCGSKTRPAHTAARYNKTCCDFHKRDEYAGNITAIICPFNIPEIYIRPEVCQSLCSRLACSGPTAWIVWIGPTPPSLWWGSAHWPISFMHWEWSTSLNCSLTQTVWGTVLYCLSVTFTYTAEKASCGLIFVGKTNLIPMVAAQ